jgi:putative permease
VLVPLMVFFLVKDKDQMLNAVRRILPRNRGLAGQVWEEMNQQITNYIRGKVLEMIVVGVATWIGFLIFGLNYSLLLAVLVGLSVLIPYIGAFVVTIPVVGRRAVPVWAGDRVLELLRGVPDYSGAGR